MNGKKVIGFLLCRSAFSQRNITSILLVLVFFGVYVLSGGKISMVPPALKGMGGLDSGASIDAALKNQAGGEVREEAREEDLGKAESRSVLGLTNSQERETREDLGQTRGRMFSDNDAQQAAEEPIDPDGLIKGKEITSRRQQKLLQKWEKKETTDSLSAIEDRLKKTRP